MWLSGLKGREEEVGRAGKRLAGREAGTRGQWAGIGPSVGEEGRSCAGLDLVVGLLGWFASSPFLPLFFFLSTQNYLNSNSDLNSKP